MAPLEKNIAVWFFLKKPAFAFLFANSDCICACCTHASPFLQIAGWSVLDVTLHPEDVTDFCVPHNANVSYHCMKIQYALTAKSLGSLGAGREAKRER